MAKRRNTPIKVEERSLERYLANKCKQLKRRATKSRKPFDLTPGFLAEMYHSQRGLCAYTGIPLRLDSTETQPDSLSVDKIEARKGYTPDNVILCSTFANTLKGTKSRAEFETSLKKTIKDISKYLKMP
jgi:hypothetical protein